MTLWLIPILVALVGIVAIGAAVRLRYRRHNRLQLRVLAGRRRLLGEEIDDHHGRLESLGPEPAPEQRQQVTHAIDLMQTCLLDREAHLLNLDDLARLQLHKIRVLDRQLHELTAVVLADSAPSPEGEDEATGSLVERRDRLEDKLLQRIQERGDPPDRPSRRRRRR